MKPLVLLFLSAISVFAQGKADVAPIELPASAKPSVSVGEVTPNPNLRSVHEFSGDEIGLVLRSLARKARMNIVVGTAVTGTINLRLEDKTPWEIINVICHVNKLTIDELNGVYYIQPWDEPRKRDAERVAHIAKLQFDAYMAKGFTRTEAFDLLTRSLDQNKLATQETEPKISKAKPPRK